MVKCDVCGKSFSSGKGCDASHFRFNPRKIILDPEILRMKTLMIERIKVGAENDRCTAAKYKSIGINNCRCCSAPIGTFHHEGCDNERCPRCGDQFITCKCTDDYMVEYISPVQESTKHEEIYNKDELEDILCKINERLSIIEGAVADKQGNITINT